MSPGFYVNSRLASHECKNECQLPLTILHHWLHHFCGRCVRWHLPLNQASVSCRSDRKSHWSRKLVAVSNIGVCWAWPKQSEFIATSPPPPQQCWLRREPRSFYEQYKYRCWHCKTVQVLLIVALSLQFAFLISQQGKQGKQVVQQSSAYVSVAASSERWWCTVRMRAMLQTHGRREARLVKRFPIGVHVSLAIPSETRRDKAIFSLLVFVDLQVLSAAGKPN